MRRKTSGISNFFEKIADRIVRGLNIKKGEHILIDGGAHFYELLVKIAVQTAVKGAFPHIVVSNDQLIKEMAFKVPKEFLSRPASQHDRYIASLYDARIFIDSILDEKLLADLPKDRKMLGVKRSAVLSGIAKARKARSIFMAWPTPEKASSCNMTISEFEDLFIRAILIDEKDMDELGDFLFNSLSAGGEVRITSQKGTDLSFMLSEERRVMIDSGKYTEDMVEIGDITKNLPCGEVYTTPVESTVEGKAVFDLVFVEGKPVTDLCLDFEKGKLKKFTAGKGIKLFEKRYNLAIGDKNRFGELGIGINPTMIKPIGHTMLDEKIYGSIHLALGENRMYGGINKSSLHWDLVMLSPTLKIAKNKLICNGKFCNNQTNKLCLGVDD